MKTIDDFIDDVTEAVNLIGLNTTQYSNHLEIDLEGTPIFGLHYYPTEGGYNLMIEETEELFEIMDPYITLYFKTIFRKVEEYIYLFPTIIEV